jgi:hypothetical protein
MSDLPVEIEIPPSSVESSVIEELAALAVVQLMKSEAVFLGQPYRLQARVERRA